MSEVKPYQVRRGPYSGEAYEVAGVHGGKVWMYSSERGYSTFSVKEIEAWDIVIPFFEKGKTYRLSGTLSRVTIHYVGKCGEHNVAYGLRTDGELYFFESGDFPSWTKE